MSFFNQKPPSGPSALDIAKMEAELLSDTFNKMTKTCFTKCVAKYNESDLQVGEMTCTDRCVGKYMQASDKIADTLKKFEEISKAQAQAQEDMMKKFK
jgi:import inner membrane translocase subunit TIM10